MTTTDAPAEPARSGLLRSPGLKFFLIAVLCGGLLVPILLVWALTSERAERRDAVLQTVAAEWAGRQTVTGPVLLLPYSVERSAMRDGRPEVVALDRRTRVILPDAFTVAADIPVERRRISIFEATAFTATLAVDGRFPAIQPADLGPGVAAVHWSEAVLVVGLGDLKGIEAVTLAAGGRPLDPQSGLGLPGGQEGQGLHARLGAAVDAAALARGLPVAMTLRLKGSAGLTVTPVGRTSAITLRSDWPHPGFATGAGLPSQRTVDASGFRATWTVPALARNVAQAWTLEEGGLGRLDGLGVGADLTLPVDFYALTERALKYGVMFIAAIFGIVFVLEILSPRRIHIVQYALVGLILVFFYVLLLAFAEQIGFGPAYGVAATATGLVLSAFVGLQLASRVRALVAAIGFAAIFAMLYLILRLEDVALMGGAVAGFTLLTIALFATRRVDWSGRGEPAVPD